MAASNLIERTLLFCFSLFLVLPKAYADPVNKKSAYSYTSENSQEHIIKFTEQQNGDSFEYIASTATTGIVVANGVSNNVEGVFRITTASGMNSHHIRVAALPILPNSRHQGVARHSKANKATGFCPVEMFKKPRKKGKNTKPELVVLLPETDVVCHNPAPTPSALSGWDLNSAPVLNRQHIDNLVANGGATTAEYSASPGHSDNLPNYYTLPLGAFRVNDLALMPQLSGASVISRVGNTVQIRAEMPYAVFSLDHFYSELSLECDLSRLRHSSVFVSIDIRLTGQDSLRVESIRSIDVRDDRPNFVLKLLPEVQEEPLPSTSVRSNNDTYSGNDDNQRQPIRFLRFVAGSFL